MSSFLGVTPRLSIGVESLLLVSSSRIIFLLKLFGDLGSPGNGKGFHTTQQITDLQSLSANKGHEIYKLYLFWKSNMIPQLPLSHWMMSSWGAQIIP